MDHMLLSAEELHPPYLSYHFVDLGFVRNLRGGSSTAGTRTMVELLRMVPNPLVILHSSTSSLVFFLFELTSKIPVQDIGSSNE